MEVNVPLKSCIGSKMSKILIVIDMQNDFLTGSLANPAACEIIPNIQTEASKEEYDGIIFTKDTHDSNYLSTPEGQKLPVEHCLKGTWGHRVVGELLNINKPIKMINKTTFGSLDLWKQLEGVDEVTLVGTCTDICVVSNALILKAALPNLIINVIADCCAGSTDKNHEAALTIMRSCQINII